MVSASFGTTNEHNAFISARWRQNNFKTTGLFKLHQNNKKNINK